MTKKPVSQHFLGGVSQQREALRLPNQLRVADNCWISALDVIRKRPPSQHFSQLYDATPAQGHGGQILKHTIDRGPGERYVLELAHQEIRAYDFETKEAIPVLGHPTASIELLAVPADNSVVTIDPAPAGGGTAFTFLAGAVGNQQIERTGATIQSAAIELARKIRIVLPTLTVFCHDAVVTVYDTFLGAYASLAAKSGGDSATSIRLDSDTLRSLDYMKAVVPKGLPLATPEGLQTHAASGTFTDPTAAAPAADTWLKFGTVPTSSYTDTDANRGPFGGFTHGSILLATRGAANQEAYFYHRFAEPTTKFEHLNKFAAAGVWQTVSIHLNLSLVASDKTDEVQIGFFNSTTSAWHRARFAFTGDVLSTSPTIIGSGEAGITDIGFGFYRIWFRHKTITAEVGQQIRPAIYFNMPTTGPITKRLWVHGAQVERGVTEPTRFTHEANAANRIMSVGDRSFIANTTKIPKIDSSYKSITKEKDEWRVTISGGIPADDTDIIIAPASGTAITFRFHVAAGLPADGPTLKHIDTTANSTVAKCGSKFLALVIQHMAATVSASAVSGTATVIKLADISGTSTATFVTEANDGGNRIAITSHVITDQFLVWVRRVNYDADYLLRARSGQNKIKTAAVVNAGSMVTAGVNTNALGYARCVGFTTPSGSTGTAALCEQTAGQDDPEKGVWVLGGGADILSGTRVGTASCEDVARYLENELNGGGKAYADIIGTNGFSASNQVERVGAVIRVTSPDAFDEIKVSDSFGGDGFVLIHDTVKREDDLPPVAPDGMRVRVTGDSVEEIDDNIFQFNATRPGTFGPGVWRPAVDYDVFLRLDASTCPHTLTRFFDTDGSKTNNAGSKYFAFEPAVYAERVVGDEDLNEDPTFVGGKIRDLSFFKNRMLFLSEQDAAFTEVGAYSDEVGGINFFRVDVTHLIDSDRFGVTVADQEVSTLNFAVSSQGKLLLFGPKNIFQEQNTGSLTPKSVGFTPALRDEILSDVRPIAVGRSIFYAYKRGAFSGIQEFFPSEEAAAIDPLDPDTAVQAYIDGEIVQIAASTLCDTLVIVCGTQFVYLYRWTDSGGQRVVSAWHRWDFGAGHKVRGCGFIGSDLSLTVERAADATVETFSLVDRYRDPGATWTCYLDRRVDESTPGFKKTLTAGNTIIQLPYLADGLLTVVKKADGSAVSAAGSTVVDDYGRTVSTLTVSGQDLTATPLWVGQLYTQAFEPSDPRLRDDEKSAEIIGRSQALRGIFAVEEANSFEVKVTRTPSGSPSSRFFDASKSADELRISKVVNAAPRLVSANYPVPLDFKVEEGTIRIENLGYLEAAFSKVTYEINVDDQENV